MVVLRPVSTTLTPPRPSRLNAHPRDLTTTGHARPAPRMCCSHASALSHARRAAASAQASRRTHMGHMHPRPRAWRVGLAHWLLALAALAVALRLGAGERLASCELDADLLASLRNELAQWRHSGIDVQHMRDLSKVCPEWQDDLVLHCAAKYERMTIDNNEVFMTSLAPRPAGQGDAIATRHAWSLAAVASAASSAPVLAIAAVSSMVVLLLAAARVCPRRSGLLPAAAKSLDGGDVARPSLHAQMHMDCQLRHQLPVHAFPCACHKCRISTPIFDCDGCTTGAVRNRSEIQAAEC
eukprot:350888-Chlamydomonas_euryale.AAC.11